MGDIILTRPGREMFRLLDYGIYVDGKKVNFIRDDTRKVLKLKEGSHEIYIRVLGAKSNILNINIKNKETVRLTCKNNLTGFKYLFSYLYIFSKNLLKLDYTKI